MIPTKNNIKPIKLKLSQSQITFLNQGSKDADGLIFLPFIFQKVKDSPDQYEMVHIFNVPDRVYARLVTCSIHEMLEDEKKLTTIEIWMEGYAATGESGTAQKIGTYQAKDFDDAIRQYIIDHPDIEKNSGPYRYTRDSFTSQQHYENRRANWKIWGCALFDNEADARKTFG